MATTSTSPTLCRYLTEIPQEKATAHYRWATVYNVAAKVAQVAIAIICTGIFAVSLGLLPALPLSLALLALLVPIGLFFASNALEALAKPEYKAYEIEQKVADQLALIQHWSATEINQFLNERNLSADRIALPANTPLTALLPLIARTLAWEQIATEALEIHVKNYHECAYDEAQPQVEFQHRALGWDALENKALPAFFQAAATLQNILHPTEEINLNQMGVFAAKPLHLRLLDKLPKQPRDASEVNRTSPYFRFNETGKAPLEIEQILAASSPASIRPLVFN